MSFQNCRIVSKDTNPVAYHAARQAERGTKEFVLSSSSLRDFTRCPSRWKAGYQSPESDAKDWGALLDCLVLTPKLFDALYAVEPLTYKSTTMECPSCKSQTDSKSCSKCKCDRLLVTVEKEWAGNATPCQQWKEKQTGKTIVKSKELTEADKAVLALAQDKRIASFVEASDKQVQVVGEWHDKATGLVIPVCCLIDIAPRKDTEFHDCLGDLKSTRNAQPKAWKKFAYACGYYLQAAWNTALYNAATGEERTTFCFALQENYPPYQTGRRIASQAFMTHCWGQIEAGMAAYFRCLKTGLWADYDAAATDTQGWTVDEPEGWMILDGIPEMGEPDAMPEREEDNDDVPML